MATGTKIRDLSQNITTFSTTFNRFAPFGCRKFVAVGNRATAIQLNDGRVLLLNPIPLEPSVQARLIRLGGVDFIAADLGHHIWHFVYCDQRMCPETEFGFAQDMETVLFEGFITYCVAWYHKPTKTLIQSDLMMNLPCTEQYSPSSSARGLFSYEFAKHAHPRSIWAKRLMYYIASVDYSLMRRDVKRVAEWDMHRIVPCHGDAIEIGGNEAWVMVYEWFLKGAPEPDLL